jgi:WD40 repeat protein
MAALLVVLAARAGGTAQELKPRATLRGHGNFIRALAFSPDGKTLASGSGGLDRKSQIAWGEITFWDVAAGKEGLSFKGHTEGIECLAFSPDGRTLATGAADSSVRLWDAATGKELAAFGRLGNRPRCVGFSPDGKTLAAAGPEGTWLWEVAGRKELRSFKRPVSSFNPALGPDGKTLASACHQDMDLWDMATGKERLTLPDHRGSADFAAFSGDGKVVAVASNRYEGGNDYTAEVKLWDAATSKERATFKRQPGVIRGVLFSHDGKALAILGEEELGGIRGVTLFDAATGRAVATLTFQKQEEAAHCLAFSPDSKLLAVGCLDGTVRLWDLLPAREK